VTLVELCIHLATERARLVTLHLTVDAPEIYPNNRHEAENAKFLRERTSDLLGSESCADTAKGSVKLR